MKQACLLGTSQGAPGLGGGWGQSPSGASSCPRGPGLASQTWREMGREVWGCRTITFLETRQVTTWVLVYPSSILGQHQSN